MLIDTEPALLRIIASRWDITPGSVRPRDIAGAVAAWLTDPHHARAIVERLSSSEREALRALIDHGGSMGVSGFAQRFGSIRPVGPARLERDQPWRAPISPAEGLWYLGLIYRSFEQRVGGMQDVMVVPAELHPLRALLAAPGLPADTLSPVAEPEAWATDGAKIADDLCTLLIHLLNPADRTWATQLRDPDPVRLEFLNHLARRARLVRPDQRKLDPTPVLAWLAAPTLDQLRGLFSAWAGDPEWNDLYHVSSLKPEETGSWSSDPLAARRAILQHLCAALPDTWHTLEALVDRIKQQQPDFARAEFDTWYLRDATTGEYLRGFGAWDQVEGALIRQILAQPLFWLGIVDLGENAFRVTPAGAAILGLSQATSATEPESRYIVHANATISVPASRRYDRFQLARIADFVSAGEVYTYRLTPASLARAEAQRIDMERMIESLQRASGSELPPPVLKAIQRWRSKGTEAEVERMVVLRAKSPAILKSLQASPKTRGLIGEILGPTTARVEEKHRQKLINALAEMGILADIIE